MTNAGEREMKYVKPVLGALVLAAVHVIAAYIGTFGMLFFVFSGIGTAVTITVVTAFMLIYIAAAFILAVKRPNAITGAYFVILAVLSVLGGIFRNVDSVFGNVPLTIATGPMPWLWMWTLGRGAIGFAAAAAIYSALAALTITKTVKNKSNT